ncbi:MAG: hypothetical protein HY709_07725 [Candidatus Latescibacteria bacterium]|nr:hypothetical protein [Candidatus Latescibacterota bacterium]
MVELKEQLERCVARFRAGTLTAADLQEALNTVGATTGKPLRQSLLYIHAPTSHPYSNVIGMSIFEEGKDPEGVDENGNFLYKSMKEALEDGWRIVKFPEMTLAMDDQNTYGLGFEFILERWR